MKQFTLKLNPNMQRPVVHIAEFHNLDALLDTGAVFPVWCADEKVLQAYGGEKISDFAPFGGFGGMTAGKLYRLPFFTMGGLIYPGMNIILHEGFSLITPLILPATIFDNLIYEINNKTHRITVTVPDDESSVRNLVIKESNGKLQVLCSSAEENAD
ncbi:MAG: hypothetical protein IKN12_09705 [Selenomonadaceae bacterium]|nr:hypothetical protein [Selenomonadaceae bacterium]